MLPEFYRFIVLNSTDQTLTYDNAARIELSITPWKMESGAMVQGPIISDTTVFLNVGDTLIATGIATGSIIDNTSNLYIGFTGTFYGKADVSGTDGTLDLYVEFATGANPSADRFPSDMSDFDVTKHCILLATLQLSTTAVDEDAAVNVRY